jgi:hypothetical protein
MRFENGKMTENSPLQIRRDVYATKDDQDEEIYHVYIKDPENDSYIMQPKAMKIIQNDGFKITLEGLKLNDIKNRWGFDFSDYGIQFIMSALSGLSGQPGTASLLLKDRDVLITYQ